MDLNQHKRLEYCRNRPKYRAGRNLTAVKTYTIISESKHLLVFGVPKVNLQNELKNKLTKFGNLVLTCVTDEIHKKSLETDFEIEKFTDVFHANFTSIQNARRAKKIIDARNFYGGILHISYASELETIDELRDKLALREREVKSRIKSDEIPETSSSANKRQTIDELVDHCFDKKPRIS